MKEKFMSQTMDLRISMLTYNMNVDNLSPVFFKKTGTWAKLAALYIKGIKQKKKKRKKSIYSKNHVISNQKPCQGLWFQHQWFFSEKKIIHPIIFDPQ